MKQNISVTFIFYLVLFSNVIMAEILFTHEDDSIAYDEANNHYIIRYVGQHGDLKEVIWQPSTNINVEVESKYRVTKSGMIEYEYNIEVADNSLLALSEFHIYARSVDQTTIKSPEAWDIFVRDTYDSNDPTQMVSWANTTKSVQAGNELEGIELKSMALPVYDTLFVRGETDNPGFVDHGPKVETHSYFRDDLIAKNFEGKAINTAIPLIPVSETFNAVETYSAFHQSLLDYMEKGYIDSILSTSITESSAAVLTALKANDVNSALSNLKDVKMLVEGKKDKPQPLIIKELRKILKFNLKFINTKLNS